MKGGRDEAAPRSQRPRDVALLLYLPSDLSSLPFSLLFLSTLFSSNIFPVISPLPPFCPLSSPTFLLLFSSLPWHRGTTMPGAKRCDLEGVPVFVVSSRPRPLPSPRRREGKRGKGERERKKEKKNSSLNTSGILDAGSPISICGDSAPDKG